MRSRPQPRDQAFGHVSERVRSLARFGFQAHDKGSGIHAEAPKGSRFWARLRQTFKRVRTSGEYLQRVRIFGHMLAETSKGSDFGRGFGKGLHFWEILQRVCIFGFGVTTYSNGFALLDICSKGSRLSPFTGLGAKGSQFLGTSGTKQKQQKSSRHFCCILLS